MGEVAQASAATPLSLVYVRPAWRDRLAGWFPRTKRPAVRWAGDIAHVAFRPIGFRLVASADGWRVATWNPSLPRRQRAHVWSVDCGTLEQAEAALTAALSFDLRPVYPPLVLDEPLNCGSEAA